MSFFKNKEEYSSEINITSLIDVVFLLLLFFMLTTTFSAKPGFKINLPKSNNTGSEKDNNNINVYVAATGEISFNGNKVSIEEVSDLLKDKAKDGTEQMVIISADEAARHGVVVQIMDKIKECGFSKITIATQSKKLIK